MAANPQCIILIESQKWNALYESNSLPIIKEKLLVNIVLCPDIKGIAEGEEVLPINARYTAEKRGEAPQLKQ